MTGMKEYLTLAIEFRNDKSASTWQDTQIYFGMCGAQIFPGSNLNFTFSNIDIKRLWALSFKLAFKFIKNCEDIGYYFRNNLKSINDATHAELRITRWTCKNHKGIKKSIKILYTNNEVIELPLRCFRNYTSKKDVIMIADKIKGYVKQMKKIERENASKRKK